jgi:hypothetical protein
LYTSAANAGFCGQAPFDVATQPQSAGFFVEQESRHD